MKPNDDMERTLMSLEIPMEQKIKLITEYRCRLSVQGHMWPLDDDMITELIRNKRIKVPLQFFHHPMKMYAKEWWFKATKKNSRPVSIEIENGEIYITVDTLRMNYLNALDKKQQPAPVMAKAKKKVSKPKPVIEVIPEPEDIDEDVDLEFTEEDLKRLIEAQNRR